MMGNIIKAYKVFASKSYRIFTNILCGVVLLVYAFVIFLMYTPKAIKLSEMEQSLAIINEQVVIPLLVTAGFVAVILAFADYFVFVGAAARHTGTMAAVRTSLYGEQLVKNGLIGDFMVNSIKTFIAGPLLGIVVAIATQGKDCVYTILAVLAIWGGIMTTIGGINLLTRRFTKTLTSMVVFSYVGVVVFGVISAVIGVVVSAINNAVISPWLVAVCAIVMVALAIMFFVIGKKDAIKGYKSGFEDKVGGK